MAGAARRANVRAAPLDVAGADPIRTNEGINHLLDPAAAVRLSQSRIGRTLMDHSLVDENGRPLRVSDLRGRPIVLSFIYTSCSFVCPSLTTRLKYVAQQAAETLGKDNASPFTVLNVSFDAAHDTPDRLREYRRARRIDAPNWRFATADATTIAALAADVGFTFVSASGGFDHLSQITVIDAQGRVYAQIYGVEIEPPALIDPLKRLALGELQACIQSAAPARTQPTMRVPRRLAQASIAALCAMIIALFSVRPAVALLGANESVVTLSFSHAAPRIHECELLVAQPAREPNMRIAQCPRERWPIYVELEVDGKLLYADTHPPSGLWRDGAVSFFERLRIPSGAHRLTVRMRDRGGDGSTQAATVETTLAPQRNMVVEYDPTRGFTFH